MINHTLLVLGVLAICVCVVPAVEKAEGAGAGAAMGKGGPSLLKQGIEKRGLWKWRKCNSKQRRQCYSRYGSSNCFKIWKFRYCNMRHFCSLRKRRSCWKNHKKGCRKFIKKERCRFV